MAVIGRRHAPRRIVRIVRNCAPRSDITLVDHLVIRFVADMRAATAFFRDTMGLKLRFESWTEFDTGATTLALHPATPQAAAGTCQVGLRVAGVAAFHAAMTAKGFVFTQPPRAEHGAMIARFRDMDGGEINISGPMA